jgi:hypothetical protein
MIVLSYTRRRVEATRVKVKGVVRVPTDRCHCGGTVWLAGLGLSGSRVYCDRCTRTEA